jgi:hypothetical protein
MFGIGRASTGLTSWSCAGGLLGNRTLVIPISEVAEGVPGERTIVTATRGWGHIAFRATSHVHPAPGRRATLSFVTGFQKGPFCRGKQFYLCHGR